MAADSFCRWDRCGALRSGPLTARKRYAIKGRMRLSYADGQNEIIDTGDLFYQHCHATLQRRRPREQNKQLLVARRCSYLVLALRVSC
jgi:hypothetical protein